MNVPHFSPGKHSGPTTLFPWSVLWTTMSSKKSSCTLHRLLPVPSLELQAGPRTQNTDGHITWRWLQSDQLTPIEIVMCIILDQFLWAFPDEEQSCGDEGQSNPQRHGLHIGVHTGHPQDGEGGEEEFVSLSTSSAFQHNP